MIERVYIDNYRTFVNCEIKLTPVTLLLGENGSGKSALFDVLRCIKQFVGGIGLASDLFLGADLTRWQDLVEQVFEIDLRRANGLYKYTLKLVHNDERRRCQVRSETLSLDGNTLFMSEKGFLKVWERDQKYNIQTPFDATRSGLSAVLSGYGNPQMLGFREAMLGLNCLRPCPPIMETDSREEEEELNPAGTNFPSWFRFISRQSTSRLVVLLSELRDVLDGFDSLELTGPADATATLRALIRPTESGKTIPFKFGELSDGQRQLIVLYTLLFGVANDERVLFLDEPENYLALREIQPWLTALIDAPGRSIAQAIVVSHNPEIINHLAREKGVWLTRESGGPTRVEYNRLDGNSPLSPSDIEARGW